MKYLINMIGISGGSFISRENDYGEARSKIWFWMIELPNSDLISRVWCMEQMNLAASSITHLKLLMSQHNLIWHHSNFLSLVFISYHIISFPTQDSFCTNFKSSLRTFCYTTQFPPFLCNSMFFFSCISGKEVNA